MSTPIERAAEALAMWHGDTDGEDRPRSRFYVSPVRAVFESIDRDALIELLRLTDYGPDSWHGAEVLADAILAHLTGGES